MKNHAWEIVVSCFYFSSRKIEIIIYFFKSLRTNNQIVVGDIEDGTGFLRFRTYNCIRTVGG